MENRLKNGKMVFVVSLILVGMFILGGDMHRALADDYVPVADYDGRITWVLKAEWEQAKEELMDQKQYGYATYLTVTTSNGTAIQANGLSDVVIPTLEEFSKLNDSQKKDILWNLFESLFSDYGDEGGMDIETFTDLVCKNAADVWKIYSSDYYYLYDSQLELKSDAEIISILNSIVNPALSQNYNVIQESMQESGETYFLEFGVYDSTEVSYTIEGKEMVGDRATIELSPEIVSIIENADAILDGAKNTWDEAGPPPPPILASAFGVWVKVTNKETGEPQMVRLWNIDTKNGTATLSLEENGDYTIEAFYLTCNFYDSTDSNYAFNGDIEAVNNVHQMLTKETQLIATGETLGLAGDLFLSSSFSPIEITRKTEPIKVDKNGVKVEVEPIEPASVELGVISIEDKIAKTVLDKKSDSEGLKISPYFEEFISDYYSVQQQAGATHILETAISNIKAGNVNLLDYLQGNTFQTNQPISANDLTALLEGKVLVDNKYNGDGFSIEMSTKIQIYDEQGRSVALAALVSDFFYFSYDVEKFQKGAFLNLADPESPSIFVAEPGEYVNSDSVWVAYSGPLTVKVFQEITITSAIVDGVPPNPPEKVSPDFSPITITVNLGTLEDIPLSDVIEGIDVNLNL